MSITNRNHKVELVRKDSNQNQSFEKYSWIQKDLEQSISSSRTYTEDEIDLLFASILKVDATAAPVSITLPKLSSSTKLDFTVRLVGSSQVSLVADSANLCGKPPTLGGTLTLNDGDRIRFVPEANLITMNLPSEDNQSFEVACVLSQWADSATWDGVLETLTGWTPSLVQGDGIDFAANAAVIDKVLIEDAAIVEKNGVYAVSSLDATNLALKKIGASKREGHTVHVRSGRTRSGEKVRFDKGQGKYEPLLSSLQVSYSDLSPMLISAKAISLTELTGSLSDDTSAINGLFTGSGVLPQIDGVTLSVGDHLILAGQSNLAENGYYKVKQDTSNFILERDSWHSLSTQIVANTICVITSGTQNKNTLWRLDSQSQPISPGVTDVTWVQVGGASSSTSTSSPQYMTVSSGLFADWRFNGDLLDSGPNGYDLATQAGTARYVISPLGLGKAYINRDSNYLRLANTANDSALKIFGLQRDLVIYACVRPSSRSDINAPIVYIGGVITSESEADNIIAYLYHDDNVTNTRMSCGGEYAGGSNSILFHQASLPYDKYTAIAFSRESVGSTDTLKMHTRDGVVEVLSGQQPVTNTGSATLSLFRANPFNTGIWFGEVQQIVLQSGNPGNTEIQNTLRMIDP